MQDLVLFYKTQRVGEWVAKRASINREAGDCEGVTETGMRGGQMVPCGECLPVILFANRSLQKDASASNLPAVIARALGCAISDKGATDSKMPCRSPERERVRE